MVGVDAEGRPRKFRSRRHYCFSHEGYLDECRRIVAAFAERYGRNPHLGAWQTDNEYGCHDTVLSYSNAARRAFRDWLREQFPAQGGNSGDIGALNRAWGNVFWSMDYADFDDIDLPKLTVTEPNPAYALAFRRFSSDQVRRFNRAQVEIIRAHSDAPISHNYMSRVTEFDHFAVGADLDIAAWDSYPLGFLEDRVGTSAEDHAISRARAIPTFKPFTMIFTGRSDGADGGSRNNSPAR
jgi:beta-galactosidase